MFAKYREIWIETCKTLFMPISLQQLPSYSSFKLPTTYSLLPKSFVKHSFLLCDLSVGKSILANSFLQLNFRSNSLSLITIPSTLLSQLLCQCYFSSLASTCFPWETSFSCCSAILAAAPLPLGGCLCCFHPLECSLTSL